MKLSILLVDDSKMMRKVIAKEVKEIFAGRDLSLTEAGSGNQALDRLRKDTFDIVFLDLTMPEVTGYDVLQSVNKEGLKANIIVLTADIQPEAEKRVRKLGAAGYVKKERPLNTAAMKEALKGLKLL